MAKTNKLGIKLKEDEIPSQPTQLSQEELQMLYLQIQQLQQEIEKVAQQKEQFKLMLQSVEELQQLEDNKEKESIITLVPGIFMKAKIKKPEKLIVNIGQNILVEKSLEETKKIIQEQIDVLKKNEDLLKQSFEDLIKNLPQ